MAFKSLEQLEGPIEIPFRGHTFTLPQLSFDEGIALQKRIAEGISQAELAQALTGDVLDDIAKAGGSIALIQRVAAVAIADFRYGRETAEKVWEDPKVLIELNQVLNQTLRSLETEIPSGAAATTRTRASGSGTKRKTPADHKPRSRGKSSSATGTSS